jgi:glucose-6-phosphate-specific signal transduction histidine kinase
MEIRTSRWNTCIRGIALSAGYCAAFLTMWHQSLDQWYLPAGLRLASLLLLPMRYWPYVFVGDVTALLYIRIPKAEQYSVQWAYLSPVLFISIYSLAPYLARKWIRTKEEIVQWISLLAIVSAVWSTIVGRLVNILLNGPVSSFGIEKFILNCVGNFLGILMVILPCLLWLQRNDWKNTQSGVLKSTVVAILMISVPSLIAMIVDVQGRQNQLMPAKFMLHTFMLLPIFFLTVMHAWHGAAIGTLLVNVAISISLPDQNIVGDYDGSILLSQVVLLVESAGLLAVGVHMSNLHEKSGDLLRSELIALHELKLRDVSEARTMGGSARYSPILRATLP